MSPPTGPECVRALRRAGCAVFHRPVRLLRVHAPAGRPHRRRPPCAPIARSPHAQEEPRAAKQRRARPAKQAPVGSASSVSRPSALAGAGRVVRPFTALHALALMVGARIQSRGAAGEGRKPDHSAICPWRLPDRRPRNLHNGRPHHGAQGFLRSRPVQRMWPFCDHALPDSEHLCPA